MPADAAPREDGYAMPRRGVIRAAHHPWHGFTGERIGTMSTPVGDGYRIRLDNGCESFVMPEEWVEGR